MPLHLLAEYYRYVNEPRLFGSPIITILSIVHSTRIATLYWGGLKRRGEHTKVGTFQGAFVPLALVLGGGTINALLLGQPPVWVKTPIPVAIYGLLPLLISKTPLVDVLLSVPTLPREIVFSFIDGFTRFFGVTTVGVDTVLAHPDASLHNPWTILLLATIAGGGGAIIAPTLGLFNTEWSFRTPPFLAQGPSLDLWGATLTAYVYATLIDAHPFFKLLPAYILKYIPLSAKTLPFPPQYFLASTPQPVLPPEQAKMVAALLLSGLFLLRTLRVYFTSPSSPKVVSSVDKAQ